MILAATAARQLDDAPVRCAIEEAARRDVPIRVMHVVPAPDAEDTASLQQWRDAVASVREHAEVLRRQLHADGVAGEVEIVPAATHGPADVLLERATELGAVVIVIGVRQRSRVGKALFGSTAQDVLLRADCSVLAVPLSR